MRTEVFFFFLFPEIGAGMQGLSPRMMTSKVGSLLAQVTHCTGLRPLPYISLLEETNLATQIRMKGLGAMKYKTTLQNKVKNKKDWAQSNLLPTYKQMNSRTLFRIMSLKGSIGFLKSE